MIQRLNKEEGTTFLLSSHQLPYLESICSHIAILHEGAIAVSGTIENLLQDSKHTLLLRSEPPSDALSFLKQLENITVINPDANGYIQLETAVLDSSELNRQLVTNNIAVSELILQRASLGNLFRSITSKGES